MSGVMWQPELLTLGGLSVPFLSFLSHQPALLCGMTRVSDHIMLCYCIFHAVFLPIPPFRESPSLNKWNL